MILIYGKGIARAKLATCGDVECGALETSPVQRQGLKAPAYW